MMIIAIPLADSAIEIASFDIGVPRIGPNTIMATKSVMSSAISGDPISPMNLLSAFSAVETIAKISAPAMRMIGRIATEIDVKMSGISSSSNSFDGAKPSGIVGFIFFTKLRRGQTIATNAPAISAMPTP